MTLRCILGAALLAAACASQAAVIYGSNLVVNGDAEAGTTGWNGYGGYGMIQSVNYGSNWVLPTQPGPADRGHGLFAGTGQYAAAWQTLDFGTATTQATAFSLSGWLGGWADQGDNALFYVQFLDESGMEIGGASLGPVTPEDRDGQTGLWYRASEGLMPTGTHAVSFWLSMERLASTDNDGYADNLSFILQAQEGEVPEPGIAATFALGLGMLGWARQRGKGLRGGR